MDVVKLGLPPGKLSGLNRCPNTKGAPQPYSAEMPTVGTVVRRIAVILRLEWLSS